METFKINDIVTPTTPRKQELYGSGIIVQGATHRDEAFAVVFPVQQGQFLIRHFISEQLESAEVDWKAKLQIKKASIMYRDIMSEQFHL